MRFQQLAICQCITTHVFKLQPQLFLTFFYGNSGVIIIEITLTMFGIIFLHFLVDLTKFSLFVFSFVVVV